VSPSLSLHWSGAPRHLSSFPTRRSSDLAKFAQLLSVLSTILGDNGLFRLLLFQQLLLHLPIAFKLCNLQLNLFFRCLNLSSFYRSEEHTSELQSRENLVCRLLLERKKYD